VRRVLLYIVRFAAIILGYAVAALAASAFLHLVTLGPAGFAEGEQPGALGSLLFSATAIAMLAAYFAFIPSLAVILIAEVSGRRDWLFYALGGIFVAVAVLSLFWLRSGEGFGAAATGATVFSDTRFAAVMIGSGIVGGIAYWLVAGRWAGTWHGPAQRPAEEEARGRMPRPDGQSGVR
jgi:hypothetical protein